MTVDTLRWDLHYAGNPHPISPRLDELAARSVVFDQAENRLHAQKALLWMLLAKRASRRNRGA